MVNELFYAYPILMISLFVFTLFLLIKISPDLVSKDEHTVFRLMIEATLFIFIVAYVDNMFRYLTVLPVAAFGAILFIFVNVRSPESIPTS